MDNLKILHIAAHMGEGAGKAISGLAVFDEIMCHRIVLLEVPKKTEHIEYCRRYGIEVVIDTKLSLLEDMLQDSDVVILNWWNHPLMFKVLTLISKVAVRLILWSHINGAYYPILKERFVKAFDACMFTSPVTFSLPLWSKSGTKAIQEKSRLVYGMGAFYPDKQPQKTDYDLHDPIRLGYVGTLDYAKINPDFLKYVRALKDKGIFAEFLMVGNISSRFEQDITSFDVADIVKLCGYRRDVPLILKNFDIFCYLLNPKNFATTENALIEAMAAGLPIICGSVSIERSIIENGVSGYTVSSPEEFVERILFLSKSTDQRKKIGETARTTSCSRYSIEANRERFYEAIELAARNPKRTHDFVSIMCGSPYEMFLYGCPRDAAEIFMQAVLCDDDTEWQKIKSEADGLGNIYKTKIKGSPYQFSTYYPEDEKLQKIVALYDYDL